MAITLVTAYVNYYRTPIINHKFRLRSLYKLFLLNIPLVIFVSPDCAKVVEEFVEKQSTSIKKNIRLIPLAGSFFESSFIYLTATADKKAEPLRLPHERFEPKDTFDYMCYLNTKVEYMKEVVRVNPFQTSHFAWCNYDLFRKWECPDILYFIHSNGLPILKHRPPSETHLEKSWNIQDQILFPGCYPEGKYAMKYLCNKVCWRYCGGFFLGTKEAIVKIHQLYLYHFPRFIDTYNTMIWDMNFWTYLEQETDWNPYIYNADHSSKLIENFPLFAFANKTRPYKALYYDYPTVMYYHPSSGSMVKYNDKCVFNVRYVNYWYKTDGHCVTMNDSKKTITKNRMFYLDPNTFEKTSKSFIVSEEFIGLPKPDDDEEFQGIEDIRLYVHNNQLKFLASTVNYSGCANNRMIYGIYSVEDHGVFLKDTKVMKTRFPQYKEKNWIPFQSKREPDVEYFIYSWYPFKMGIMDNDYFKITHSYDNSFPINTVTVRGSSNVLFENNSYVALVHVSEENTLPKRYFHMLVWLNENTYRPMRHSKLFYFDQYGPEFCLTFDVQNDNYVFWISRYDRDPVTLYYPKKLFH